MDRPAGLERWPSQSDSEMPDCGLFSCNYRNGQKNYFTDDQAEIVTIYEVGLSGRAPFANFFRGVLFCFAVMMDPLFLTEACTFDGLGARRVKSLHHLDERT